MSREFDKESMQTEQKRSRRTFLKNATNVTIGLFSFIPAVQNLLKNPLPKPGYIPCSLTRCVYLGQKCVAQACGPSTIVKAWDCIDVFYESHCFYKTEDTGIAC